MPNIVTPYLTVILVLLSSWSRCFLRPLDSRNNYLICCSLCSIENQHVQFKVDANPQNVDAAKVAEVLEEDINLKKRLTDTLGVDVANVAASDRVSNLGPFRDCNPQFLGH